MRLITHQSHLEALPASPLKTHIKARFDQLSEDTDVPSNIKFVEDNGDITDPDFAFFGWQGSLTDLFKESRPREIDFVRPYEWVSYLSPLHYYELLLQRKRSSRAEIGKYNHRVKQQFGAMKLSEIERHDIQQFITDLREEDLAPATCDRYLQMIRFPLRLAVDWGFLDKNCAKTIPLYNADNKVENDLSDEEMSRLMQVLKTDDNRVVCSLLVFMLASGAR